MQIVYKEDYEQDKAYIMFPYTITPEYETKSSVKRMDVSVYMLLISIFQGLKSLGLYNLLNFVLSNYIWVQ